MPDIVRTVHFDLDRDGSLTIRINDWNRLNLTGKEHLNVRLARGWESSPDRSLITALFDEAIDLTRERPGGFADIVAGFDQVPKADKALGRPRAVGRRHGCPKCGQLSQPYIPECPLCGWTLPAKERGANATD